MNARSSGGTIAVADRLASFADPSRPVLVGEAVVIALVTALLDALLIMLGAWILWNSAVGPSAAYPSFLGLVFFTIVTSALFAARGLLTQGFDRALASRNRVDVLRALPVAAETGVRAVLLVIAAAGAQHWFGYGMSWGITYAALLSVTIGVMLLIGNIVRGDSALGFASAFVTALSGAGALISTTFVHEGNLDFLFTICAFILSSYLISWIVRFWVHVAVDSRRQHRTR